MFVSFWYRPNQHGIGAALRIYREGAGFIINNDIKYRMGKALFGEEENGEEEED